MKELSQIYGLYSKVRLFSTCSTYYENGFYLSIESNPSLVWFYSTELCDWFKSCATLLNQSDTKPNPITTWSRSFSRAWRVLSLVRCVLYVCCDWSMGLLWVWSNDAQWKLLYKLNFPKLLPIANWNNFQLCCSLFWICSTLSWTRATKIRKEAQRTWRKYHGRNLKPTKKNKVKRNKTTVVRW